MFDYTKPKALSDALRLLRNGTTALAGGTDLLTLVRHGIASPSQLVDLTGLEGLRGWTREKGKGLRIGALTPPADIEIAAIGNLTSFDLATLLSAAGSR